MNTIYHKKEEFKNFPFDEIINGSEFATNGKTKDGRLWSFGEGGSNYPGGSNFIISIYGVDSDKEETWELPDFLHRWVKWSTQYAVSEFKKSVKRLFDNN